MPKLSGLALISPMSDAPSTTTTTPIIDNLKAQLEAKAIVLSPEEHDRGSDPDISYRVGIGLYRVIEGRRLEFDSTSPHGAVFGSHSIEGTLRSPKRTAHRSGTLSSA